MDSAAPKAAPLETPRVNGVARGLRNMAWKAAPAAASPAPARNPNRTRGTRKRQKISASAVPEKGANAAAGGVAFAQRHHAHAVAKLQAQLGVRVPQAQATRQLHGNAHRRQRQTGLQGIEQMLHAGPPERQARFFSPRPRRVNRRKPWGD